MKISARHQTRIDARIGAWLAAVLIACAVGTAPAAPPSGGAITISPLDFRIPRNDLVRDAERLNAMPEQARSTADYAERYQKLQERLLKANPPLSSWSREDQSLMHNVPEPDEQGVKALANERRQSREQQRKHEAELDAYWEQRAQDAARQEKARVESERLEREQAAWDEKYEEAVREATDPEYGPWWPGYGLYPGWIAPYPRPPLHPSHPGHHGGNGHHHGSRPVKPGEPDTSNPKHAVIGNRK